MRTVLSRLVPLVAGLTLLLGCSRMPPLESGPSADIGEPSEELALIGSVTRAEIEAVLPHWVSSTVDANADLDAALGLLDVAVPAHVTVFFGSWCEDSQRELSRLWKALDLIGGEVDFSIEYVGLDRSKKEPTGRVDGREILYVPTLVVERSGHEMGRIVESAPGGVESDLLALLNGELSGWISGREDLPESGDDQEL